MSGYADGEAAQPGSATAEAAVASSSTIAVILPRKPFWGARIVQVPLFRALRVRYPESRIVLFASADGADEFVRWRLGDELHEDEGRAGLPGAVRREHPEMVLNLRRKSTVSCVATGISGAHRPSRCGCGPTRSTGTNCRSARTGRGPPVVAAEAAG